MRSKEKKKTKLMNFAVRGNKSEVVVPMTNLGSLGKHTDKQYTSEDNLAHKPLTIAVLKKQQTMRNLRKTVQ